MFFFRSLSSRLLLFNVLILFLPMASLLLLGTYENQLLSSQENSMIQQGRILASALDGAVSAAGESGSETLAAEALRILENLRGRTDSRIRVLDSRGFLLADSAVLVPPLDPESRESYAKMREIPQEQPEENAANTSFLYNIAVYPVKVLKKFVQPPPAAYSGAEYYSAQHILLGPEIKAALEGRYGAATRYSSGGQVSIHLYSAIPVFGSADNAVIGAVLVSRSSYGILLNLYRLRLDIIRIFFISLIVSLVLSLGLSLSITVPIKKLKTEAEGVFDQAGHFSGHFKGLKRRDEIGDLSRSLHGLSQKLEKRIAFIDRFISDLLHELKNPLAAIRAQTELALSSPVKEEKLLGGIAAEESRVERFLGRLRELSRIDNVMEQETSECIDLAVFIPLLLERYSSSNVVFENRTNRKALVKINPDRLMQALTNPMDNALSFSPAAGTVTVILEAAPIRTGQNTIWRIIIEDEGPGIREVMNTPQNAERYFERFYSERPEADKENHSGLGLSIVKAIAEASGGSCSIGNRHDGETKCGCRFILTLPENYF